MIVVDEGDKLRIITQPDHARFARDLLSLWRTDDLPEHPRREPLLFAVREHDNGWREVDAAPRIHPITHRPLDFTTYPEEDRLDIWRRGILRFADRHPYATLLFVAHAEAIHQPLSEAWLELFRELEPLRQDWLDRAAIDEGRVKSDYRWLELADALSLVYCTGGTRQWLDRSPMVRVESEFLRLDPFPLAGTTTFQIPVRRVPNRDYPTDSQFGSQLARARWQRMTVKVAPF